MRTHGKLMPLSLWIERNFEKPPSARMRRRWIEERRIEPLPEKNGRAYFVPERAKYWEPGTKPPLLERLFPGVIFADEPEEDADGYLPSKNPRVLQLRKDRKEPLLPLDQLRALPRVTDDTRWSGVYFLWRQARLVYIGEALNIRRRIYEHHRDGKRFTHATSLYFQPQSKMEIEERYVLKYRPPLNLTRHG